MRPAGRLSQREVAQQHHSQVMPALPVPHSRVLGSAIAPATALSGLN